MRIPKIQGQKGLTILREMGLLNRWFRVQREQDFLYVPLIREPSAAELNELSMALPEFEICLRPSEKRVERQLKPVDLLSEKMPPHILASFPRAIDFIGDIAVVETKPELENYKQFIGEAVLKANKRVKSVLAKSGAIRGVFRLRKFAVIGGEAKTKTVHREHGCVFHVDLAKAYFSPRLSHEHSRVASLVRQGETVVDMFAGVGPFSILIAKKHGDVCVYAIDVNPEALEFLKKNIRVNRVESRVKPLLGDARRIVDESLNEVADRVIMNLPESAIEYLHVACRALKPEGGVIHYYEFSSTRNPLEISRSRLKEALKHTDRRLEKILLARIVRGTAPFAYQVVIDAKIR